MFPLDFRKIISESGRTETENQNRKSETTPIRSILFYFSGFVEKCQRTNFPDKKASHARPSLSLGWLDRAGMGRAEPGRGASRPFNTSFSAPTTNGWSQI